MASADFRVAIGTYTPNRGVEGFTWSGGEGSTDKPPMRREDPVMITSVTKAVTAIQALTLVERGLITLTTPIVDVIPEFAENGKTSITLRHLLDHSSGLDLRCNTAEKEAPHLTASDHLTAAITAQLSFPPGSMVQYCSPGFWVLAEVISRLSGMHYKDHLQAEMLGPLGMSRTGYYPEDRPRTAIDVSSPKNPFLGEQVRKLAYPAGGLFSTTEDLLTLAQFLLGMANPDGPLSPPARELAFRPSSPPGFHGDGRPHQRSVVLEKGGPGDFLSDRSWWCWGAGGAAIWIDLDRSLAVVLLADRWYLPFEWYATVINMVMNVLFRSSGDQPGLPPNFQRMTDNAA